VTSAASKAFHYSLLILVSSARQGVKRKYSLVVKNVPKNHDQKKFAKFLQEHDVSFSKIKKVDLS